MLRISRLTDYATVVMTCLAADADHVFSTTKIAQCTHLELPTVSKLMKILSRANLVESFRGINGGYRLSRAATDISLADIVEAMEGPLAMTECSLPEGTCVLAGHCSMQGNWQYINQVISRALEQMSLAEMLRPANSQTSVGA